MSRCPRHLAAAVLLPLLAATTITGCADGNSTPTGPTTSTSTSTTSPSPLRLVQPAGYEQLKDDPLSGPLSRNEIITLTALEYSDVGRLILRSGFEQGVLQNWGKQRDPLWLKTADPTEIANNSRPFAAALVLRFSTPESALRVHRAFLARDRELDYTSFAVDPAIPNGHGGRKVVKGANQALPTQYQEEISWCQGRDYWAVSISRPQSFADVREVTDLAFLQMGRPNSGG